MNKKLKAKIIERFGSQFEFALRIGVHESDVSRVVRRKKPLPADVKNKWAKVLKCKPEDVFEA